MANTTNIPVNKPAKARKHAYNYNPYSKPPTSSRSSHHEDLDQLQHGIVAGSSVSINNKSEKSLLSKCVGWLFGPSDSSKKQLPSSCPSQPQPKSPLPVSLNLYPPTSTSTRSLANYSTRRHPTTAHAQLQIFPPPNQQTPKATDQEVSMRSPSPIRPNSHEFGIARSTSPFRSTFTQSSLFHAHPTPLRLARASSVFGNPPPITSSDSSFFKKRNRDEMSISPFRKTETLKRTDHLQAPPHLSTSASGFEDNDYDQGFLLSSSSEDVSRFKKQMAWDPVLGFMTKEQLEKVKFEEERLKREAEGRPFPKNEAERILEALESRRGTTSSLSEARRSSSQLISPVPVPTPTCITSQRSSSIQLLSRAKSKNSLAALYEAEEEELLGGKRKKKIAPDSKRLDQDQRRKRLEERKGKLREELRKLRQYEDNLINSNNSKDDQNINKSSPTNVMKKRTERSMSTETARVRRSSRKIGKLTSCAALAKANSGRRSRDPSVNNYEDENHVQEEDTSGIGGRVTRSRAGTLNKSIEKSAVTASPSLRSKKATKNNKYSMKSPSPIQEAVEEIPGIQIGSPTSEENLGLKPLIRSSSASLQPLMLNTTSTSSTTATVIASQQQKSNGSLRPGRTFSSRRHVKATANRVFSAREEDLPSLDGEDDGNDDVEGHGQVSGFKKIRLPTTFPSSFKLEKFAAPKASSTTTTTIDSGLGSSNVGPPPGTVATSNLFSGPTTSFSFNITPTATMSDKPEDNLASANSNSSTSISFNKLAPPAPSLSSAGPKVSPFFTKPTEMSASRVDNHALIGGLGRIPSDVPPPNFFEGIISTPTNTTSATTNRTADQPTAPTTANLFHGIGQREAAKAVASDSQPDKAVISQPPLFGKAPSSNLAPPSAPAGLVETRKSLFGGGSFTGASSSNPPASVAADGSTGTKETPKLSFFGAPASGFAFGAAPSTSTSNAAGPSSGTPSLFGNINANSVMPTSAAPSSSAPAALAPPPTAGFSFASTAPSALTSLPNTAAATSSSNLFGVPSDQAPSSSSSSKTAPPAPALALAPASTTTTSSLFGNTSTTAPATTPFNFNNASSTPSTPAANRPGEPGPIKLFGSSMTGTTSASVPAPLTTTGFNFGGPSTGFSFNQQQTSNTAAQGSTTTASSTPGFGFGAASSASPAVASTSSSGIFGQPNQAHQPPSTGAFNFGTPVVTASSSTPDTGNVFRQPQTPAISATPTSGGFNFGPTSTSFGAPSSSSSTGFATGFGTATNGQGAGVSLFGNSSNPVNTPNGLAAFEHQQNGSNSVGMFGAAAASPSAGHSATTMVNGGIFGTADGPSLNGIQPGGSLPSFGSMNGSTGSPFAFGSTQPLNSSDRTSSNFSFGASSATGSAGGATTPTTTVAFGLNNGVQNGTGTLFNIGASPAPTTTSLTASGRNVKRLPGSNRKKR